MKYISSTVFKNVNNYDYSPEKMTEIRRFLDDDEYPENFKFENRMSLK